MSTLEDTTGRVTRSLRKRLTSVDSDACSRPGTPIVNNLQPIAEINTPSKRATRRNSINTPAATPSKIRSRFDLTESVSSPARRSTRRRSQSVQDQDEHVPQTALKEPQVDVVKEEESNETLPSEGNRRVTRSLSKSPLEIKKKDRSKVDSVKSRRRKSVNLDTSDESPLSKTKKNSKVLIKKEKIINEMIVERDSPLKRSESETPEKKEMNASKKNEEINSLNDSCESAQSVDATKGKSSVEEKLSIKNNSEQDGVVNISSSSVEGRNESVADKKLNSSNAHDSGTGKLSDTLPSVIEIGLDNSKCQEGNESEDKNSTNRSRSEQGSPSKKKTRPEKLRNVIFEENSDDDAMKNVYPKTPGLTKSKSYINDSPKDAGEKEEVRESQEMSFAANRKTIENPQEDEEDAETLETKTPYKMKLMNVESSTPIQVASPNKNKTPKQAEQEKMEVSIEKPENTSTIEQFPRSWSHSVSGTVKDTPKIDVIMSESAQKKKFDEEQALAASRSSSFQRKNTSSRVKLDDSDSDVISDDMLEEDADEEEYNEEEGEERNCGRTIFVEDEAMEVPDGEESMCSSERRYMDENEIPARGESIGSQDTDEDEDEIDEAEDDGFIVSDDEDIIVEENSESDEEVVKAPKEKKYKRITKMSESSCENETEKTDLQLRIESTDDEIDQNESTSEKKRKSFKKAIAQGRELSVNKSGRKSLNTPEPDIVQANILVKNKKSLNSSKNKAISESNITDEEMDDPYEFVESSKRQSVTNKPSGSQKQRKFSMRISDEQISNNPENNDSFSVSHEALGVETKVQDLNAFKPSSSKLSPNKASIDGNLSLDQSKKLGNKTHDSEIDGDKQTEVNSSRHSLKNKSIVRSLIEEEKEHSISSKCSDLTLSATEEPNDSPAKSPDVSKNKKSLDRGQFLPENLDKPQENNKPFGQRNVTDEVEVGFSDSDAEEARKLKEKSAVMEFLGEEDTDTISSISKKSLRESLNQSRFNDTFELDPKGLVSSNDDSLHQSILRKSLNQSQLRRQSINAKRTDSESKDDDQSGVQEISIIKRKSLNQNRNQQQAVNSSLIEVEEHSVSDRKSLNHSLCHKKRSTEESGSDEKEEESDSTKNQIRKALNHPQLQRESIHEKKDEPNSENNTDQCNSTSNEEEEEMSAERARESPQSIRKKRNETESEENNDSDKEDESEVKKEQIRDRKSLNHSPLQKQSVLPKMDKPHSKDDKHQANSSSSDEDEEQAEEEATRERLSLNQSQLRRQDVHRQRAETESEENNYLDKEEKKDSKAAKEQIYGRKSVNHSQVQRQSVYEKRDEPESEDDHHLANSSSSDEEEEQIEEKVIPERRSLNQSQLRRQSIHKTRVETDSDDGSDDYGTKTKNKSFSNRKSFNQSHLQRQNIRDEELKQNSDDDNNSTESSERQKVKVHSSKKAMPGRCLSVSLNNVEVQKKKAKDKEAAIHNSFTIGVSVRPSSIAVATKPSASNESEKDNNSCEQEDTGETYPKDILSRSLKSTDVIKQEKRIKRLSINKGDNAASKSFIENSTQEKIKSELKRKRLSNSFCEVSAPRAEVAVPGSQAENKPERKKTDTDKTIEKVDIQHILNRCDEMLEAANRAKRQAKLNARKAKVKKPKWMNKEQKKTEEEEVKIPMVSKKELKRKEKIKKELARAIKHSTILLNTIDPKLTQKLKSSHINKDISSVEEPSSGKRLPSEILEALEDVQPKKKRPKDVDNTPPSDKENSRKKQRNLVADLPDKKQKKKAADLEIIETACGKVIVEPATPVKLKYQNGFRESPKTPAGFIVQDLNSAGRDKNKTRKTARSIFTASGPSTSNSMKKSQKRKINKRTIPKTQWTSSGAFIEEDLHLTSILPDSASTQFMVASLNSGKKAKNIAPVMSAATLNSALSFKQNALFNNKVKRESSRGLMQRKQRKFVNSQF